MYRARRVANRIIDQQMREIADKKHQEALRKVKPQIDTKRPPPVPRLVVYEKHQTRDRNYQIIDEAMKIRTIQEIEEQKEEMRMMRSNSSRRSTRPRLIDWQTELPRQSRTANARRSLPIQRPVQISIQQPPSQKDIEMQTEVLEDDGMMVVDTSAASVPFTDVVEPRGSLHTFATAPTPEQSEAVQDNNY